MSSLPSKVGTPSSILGRGSSRMQGIADMIDGKIPAIGYYAALEGLQNMPQDLQREFLKGLARGYIDSALSLGIGHYTPGGNVPGGFMDKLKDLGIGFEVGRQDAQDELVEFGQSIANQVLR